MSLTSGKSGEGTSDPQPPRSPFPLPMLHEHSFTLINPMLFKPKSFEDDKVSESVRIVWAKTKREGLLMAVFVCFDCRVWTMWAARLWLWGHGLKYLTESNAKKREE